MDVSIGLKDFLRPLKTSCTRLKLGSKGPDETLVDPRQPRNSNV